MPDIYRQRYVNVDGLLTDNLMEIFKEYDHTKWTWGDTEMVCIYPHRLAWWLEDISEDAEIGAQDKEDIKDALETIASLPKDVLIALPQ